MNNFIPQMQPWFDSKETTAIVNYMNKGGWLTEFKETQTFARMIAEFTGAKYCSILANGTVTLTTALIALGIGRDDEVIVPAYTMIASANSVSMAFGAVPVFCDVEIDTMCMDFESMKSAVTAKTKAIMLVSINGRYPSRLSDIIDFYKQNNIFVVEDAAQSLGSYYMKRHVGTFGNIGSFSFSMPKIITTGQGGALITDDEDIFKKIELVRNFGRESAGIDKHVFYGVNFKFTDLQAVVGIEQMKKLAERIQLKKQLYSKLQKGLRNVKQVKFFETSTDVAPWFTDILVDDPNALQKHLKSDDIGSRPFYPALHTQSPFNMNAGLFPNAEYLAVHGLWLPSAAQITDYEILRIVTSIQNYYQL